MDEAERFTHRLAQEREEANPPERAVKADLTPQLRALCCPQGCAQEEINDAYQCSVDCAAKQNDARLRACLLVEHSTPPSEAGIEAAAMVLAVDFYGHPYAWDRLDEENQEHYRQQARAVILAHQAHRKGEISNG